MSDKKQTLILIIITGALILIAAGITYAYFTAGGVSGKETVSTVLVTGGRLEIEYENLSNVITVNNIYPRNDEWVTKNFKVTGTNTTDLKMKYKVGIEVSSSTFNDSELTYSLTNTRVDSGTAISNITSEGLPTSGTKWFGTGSFVNGTSQVHSYTFKLYFKDNNTNQNGAQEKTMTSKVVIEEDGTESAPTWINPATIPGTYFGWGSEASTLAGADTKNRGFVLKKTSSTLASGWNSSSREEEVPYVCVLGVTEGTEVCVNYKTTNSATQCANAGGTLSGSGCILGSVLCYVNSDHASCNDARVRCIVYDNGSARCT